jgi:hypothetical protein
MWFPYLPKEYIEFIDKTYNPLKERIEDRLFFFYTRNLKNIPDKLKKQIKTEKKPLVVDNLIQKHSEFVDLVLYHPNWFNNYKLFRKPIETIDIPFLINSLSIPYTYPFVYLNECTTHIDFDNFVNFFKGDIQLISEMVLKFLEQKGTFVVLTGKRGLYMEYIKEKYPNLVWKEVNLKREVFI